MELLHPATHLRRVEVEGVAPIDAERDDLDSFLGVDITEYYDGESLETASAVKSTA
jgi:hypothetical protein